MDADLRAVADLGLTLGEIPALPELLATLRPAWMADAACAEHDQAKFFSTRGRQSVSGEPARAVCERCPVRVECLDYALADPTLEGLWAGTSAPERRLIRRRRSAA